MYQVETKTLTRAVRRNADRFPADFMYQLTTEEAAALRSQIGTFKAGRGRHRLIHEPEPKRRGIGFTAHIDD